MRAKYFASQCPTNCLDANFVFAFLTQEEGKNMKYENHDLSIANGKGTLQDVTDTQTDTVIF